MFFVVLFALIVGGGGFLYSYNDPWEPTSFFAVMGGFIGGVIGFIIALGLGEFMTTPDDWQKYRGETEIISLSNSTTLSGEFFLGTGSVDGRKMYYYYVDTDKGAINRRLPATDTYVEEADKSVQPKIVRVWYESEANYIWYFPTDPEKVESLDGPYTQIIVPEGSIKRQYNPN